MQANGRWELTRRLKVSCAGECKVLSNWKRVVFFAE